MFGRPRKHSLKKFGEIAVERGLASPEDINKALDAQKEFHSRQKIHKEIGGILIEHGVLTPEDVKRILEIQDGQMGRMAWFATLFGLNR